MDCRAVWGEIVQLRVRDRSRVKIESQWVRDESCQDSGEVVRLLNPSPDKALPWECVSKAGRPQTLPLSCPRTPVNIPSLLQAL